MASQQLVKKLKFFVLSIFRDCRYTELSRVFSGNLPAMFLQTKVFFFLKLGKVERCQCIVFEHELSLNYPVACHLQVSTAAHYLFQFDTKFWRTASVTLQSYR